MIIKKEDYKKINKIESYSGYMKIKLIPEKSFDEKSKETIILLVKIAEDKLKELGIPYPKKIEFYDNLDDFIKKIVFDVKSYGLTENQSIEFIKASLNSGSYGTFDIHDNSIIEMNFNPHFRFFYPAIHFLNLLIHESLHLFLYSKIKQDIYKEKFKFKKGLYIGEKKILQLDEGFATFLTEKILKNFNFNSIKDLPIYSGMNESPKYKRRVDNLDIKSFNSNFNKVYQENSEKGYLIIKNEFEKMKGLNIKEKITKIIKYIQYECNGLFKHE